MEVALAAIALAATAVGAMAWSYKHMTEKLTTALTNNALASQKQAKSSDEVLKFMKNLNGKFEKAYSEKMEELNIEEQ